MRRRVRRRRERSHRAEAASRATEPTKGRGFRCAAIVVAAGTLASACATEATSAPTSLVPLVPSEILPVSTPAPSTTAALSSDPNSPLIADLATAELATNECGYADPIAGGEVTFVAGDRLFGASTDATIVRCLAELGENQRGPVKWSPDANRAVLNASTVFDIAGRRYSGFDVENTRVHWEHPDGAAMFAPTASGRTLVRRDGLDPTQRTEVTFLARTAAAVDHPSGAARIAAGEGGDGTRGVFTATDDGEISTLAVANPDLEITELAADPGGAVVYFVADNGAQFRLYQLTLADLTITELSSDQSPIIQLTSGGAPGTLAWKVGLCNNITSTRIRDGRSGTVVDVGVGTPIETLSQAPVGWLDAARLVVATRPLGCDGPADVWIWNLLDGSATLLVKTVEFASVRIAAPPSAAFTVSPTATPPTL
jgi:hypothetical protein